MCVCECGNIKEVASNNLITGKIKSCGCLLKDGSHTTHGKCNSRLYKTWVNMKTRCYDKNNKEYMNYGGRGIIVCKEWLSNFKTFYDWAINNGYDDTLTIDRINVDGNYEPSNCRFIDIKTQQRNRSNNRYITINNETHCLSEWCELLNLKYSRVSDRINKLGWNIYDALEIKGGVTSD